MSRRKPYPSDLSDARWALIEPTLAAWRKARLDRRPTGQPTKVDLRDIFNALLYINRTGIPWKYLQHDFPNHVTVYAYYAAWRDEGILTQLNYDLTGLARVKEGRKPEPTDAAKKIVGRKRGILTDMIGLIRAVTATAASLSENAVGIQLLDQAKKTYLTNLKELGRHRLQERRYRARRQPRNRRRSRQQKHRSSRLPCGQKALGCRTKYWLDHAAPAPRPRLRDPARKLRGHDPRRLDRQPHQAHNGRDDTHLARNLLEIKGNPPRSNAL
ncbi:Transposase [Streptomyces mirabilis]|uniref:Transposase n=1 Tax=Streptomyces mirabilis TaxID=68239 RepID=A0A1I2UV53_9ACTN|nr:Transposase [Streptomyces mirabilis]